MRIPEEFVAQIGAKYQISMYNYSTTREMQFDIRDKVTWEGPTMNISVEQAIIIRNRLTDFINSHTVK